ncbi:MAG: glycosyltransferase family 4 protein [Acidobacteriota bacterium]
MSRPLLAAITFDDRGGGVAKVARLLRRVLFDHWPQASRVIELVRDPGDPPSFDSGPATRVGFGVRVVVPQLLGRCDWILYSHLALAHVQRFVPEPFRRPYAVFLHDIEAWGPMSAARRRVLRHAFLRLANSTYTAERVMREHPDAGRILACPLALEPTETRRGSADELANAERPETPMVLSVGRMSSREQYKGHDQLLEAWPRVLARVPGARLVYAGTGDDIARLTAKATALGVADSLNCPGFVSTRELARLYTQAAVFAMPSRREGFGLVYLEAMSHRLPCIGSTHDAAGDIIQDGHTGFLVDQSDIGGLADRLTRLLTDDLLRRRMGEAGARRVAEQFTYERFASRLIGLVSPALRERLAAPASATRLVP